MVTDTQNSAGLAAVRDRIDALDDDIERLLGERFSLVAEVKALKGLDAGSGAAPAMRPAREARILKRLLTQNEGRVPPVTLIGIWCEIMAAATQLQSVLRVHRPESAKALAYHDLIRRRFGSLAPIVEQPTVVDVVDAVAKGNSDIGVLPAAPDAYAALIEHGGADVRVIAQLPVWAAGNGERAYVAGKAPFEASGDDTTLIAVRGDAAVPGGVEGTATPHGACEAAGAQWQVLRLKEFVAADDARLAEGVRHLGGFPNPIELGDVT